jgi:sugar phosphate isomerase/epimerase
MKLSVCPQPFYEIARSASGLEGVLDGVRALGLKAMELPVDGGSPLVDLEELLGGGWKRLASLLRSREITISALSIHQEGQLLLGPHHADTDAVFEGTPEEKSSFAAHRLVRCSELARRLKVPVVVGFVGCEDYSRFFPWPDPSGWEKMRPTFRERVLPILDRYAADGVVFAQEPHPKQFVYNTETALESVELIEGHPAWGFNLDPANLMLAGVDPCLFVQELGGRIKHVHAKDGELVPHTRSGRAPCSRTLGSAGSRLSFPHSGVGDVPWKRLISTLALVDYDGFLAIENEDPIFDPHEGLRKAVHELAPLLPEGPRSTGARRWW